MSWILHDPDEWETVVHSDVDASGFGGVGVSLQRRAPEDIARIKAEKLKAHEDAVLAEAERIKARRAALPAPLPWGGA